MSKVCVSLGVITGVSLIFSGYFHLLNNTNIAQSNPNSTDVILADLGNHTNIRTPDGRSLNNKFNISPESESIANFLSNNESGGYESKLKNTPFSNAQLSNDAPKSAAYQLPKLNEMSTHNLAEEISKPNFNLKQLDKLDKKKLNVNLLNKLIKNPWGMPPKQQNKTVIYVVKNGNIDLDKPNSGGLISWEYMEEYNPHLIKLLSQQQKKRYKAREVKMKNP